MKPVWTIALALTALLAVSASVAQAQGPAPRAADCTACARTCKGRCEATAGGCVCRDAGAGAKSAGNLDDCLAACARSAGADASALEACRANCRSQVPRPN